MSLDLAEAVGVAACHDFLRALNCYEPPLDNPESGVSARSATSTAEPASVQEEPR